MQQRKLLVIIVSYNSMPWLTRCYDSLRASTVQCDVLTVDNGSSDGTREYIQKYYPEVILVESSSNLGFGKANNIGLQKAIDEGYDYIYLLNQDAWVKPDTFENLIEIAERHPEYGVLSPMQMQSNEQHLDAKFADWVIGHNQHQAPKIIDDMFLGSLHDVYEVDFVMAAHWLITRKCLLKTGGFSPTFHQYGEDDNYVHRILHFGLKVGIVPQAKAVHDRSDKSWSEEKRSYINNFVLPLAKISDPRNSMSFRRIIVGQLVSALMNRDKISLRMARQIWHDRKKILANYQKSLGECAFLRASQQ